MGSTAEEAAQAALFAVRAQALLQRTRAAPNRTEADVSRSLMPRCCHGTTRTTEADAMGAPASVAANRRHVLRWSGSPGAGTIQRATSTQTPPTSNDVIGGKQHVTGQSCTRHVPLHRRHRLTMGRRAGHTKWCDRFWPAASAVSGLPARPSGCVPNSRHRLRMPPATPPLLPAGPLHEL